MKTILKIRYVLESKVLQDAPVKLYSSFFLVTRTMQVMFVLRFYQPDKTDKINRLIHDSGSKDKQSCQKADVCIKIFSSYSWQYSVTHSFQIRSKETVRILYPKNLVLDMILRIYLRYGSFGSIFLFLTLEKKRNKISVFGLKRTFKNKCRRIECLVYQPWSAEKAE